MFNQELVEKSELLAGLPTSRVDHGRGKEPGVDDYNDYLNNMKTIDAESCEVSPAMIPDGETSKQKDDANLRVALDAVSDASGPDSEGKGTNIKSDNECDNDPDNNSPEKVKDGNKENSNSKHIEGAPDVGTGAREGGGGGHGSLPPDIV